MSIWATRLVLDGTWDEDPPPIIYQASHVTPTGQSPRGGLLDTATIPSHIGADGRGEGEEDGPPVGGYVRFSVAERVVTRDDVQPGEMVGTAPGMQTVILDRGQVRALIDDLLGSRHAPECDGARSWACPCCGGSGERPDMRGNGNLADHPDAGLQGVHKRPCPARSEVMAALRHDDWCDLLCHTECCGKTVCSCTVADLVGVMVSRGWLTLAEESADG